MADIDSSNPTDNSIVSQFPGNERSSRSATETNLYLEHSTDVGRHQFGVGNDATRNAITNWVIGGFWLNTSRTPAILQRVVSIDPDVWENVERTNAQVKTDYESNAQTNAYTDAEKTKVGDITVGSFVGIQVVPPTTTVIVKTDYNLFIAPWGKKLTAVHAEVATAGTTGLTTIDVNLNGTSMLSTKITIDSAETGSDTAGTAAVIDTGNDDVVQFDRITVDVDGVSVTAPLGLTITLTFT